MSQSMKCPLWNVLSLKCPLDEISHLWNVPSTKCPNVSLMKCPICEMSCRMKCSIYDTSYLCNVLSMLCPVYEMSRLWNSPFVNVHLWNYFNVKSPNATLQYMLIVRLKIREYCKTKKLILERFYRSFLKIINWFFQNIHSPSELEARSIVAFSYFYDRAVESNLIPSSGGQLTLTQYRQVKLINVCQESTYKSL